MSANNNPLSLTDKQLIHRLSTEYNYTQSEISEIVGCSQSSVNRTLSTPIEVINEQVSVAQSLPLSSGCYRAAYSDNMGEDYQLSLYQQAIDPYSDPVLEEVMAEEEA